jgi:hypothetical protein
MCTIFVIVKVNNRPMGEYSPNPVTLVGGSLLERPKINLRRAHPVEKQQETMDHFFPNFSPSLTNARNRRITS